VVGLTAFTGCRKDNNAGPAEPAKAEANPQVIAKLAKADLVDGNEDKVVHRCAGCWLGMDGDEAHVLVVGDYQLHFCSASCRDRFAKDVTGNTLALRIPEGD